MTSGIGKGGSPVHSRRYQIGCKFCGCMTRWDRKNPADAILDWTHRPADFSADGEHRLHVADRFRDPPGFH
jgi:hypothetical protein